MRVALKKKGLIFDSKTRFRADITKVFKKEGYNTQSTVQIFFTSKKKSGMVEIPLDELRKWL